MFKNFNWGHGIALFYVVFAAVMGTALYASFGVDSSLVDDNYYQKDIAYQSQYEKSVNTLSTEKLIIDQKREEQRIDIAFEGVERLSGTAFFYRPSDKKMDFTVQLDSGTSQIDTKQMASGKWVLKLEVKADGKSYYKEQMLFI